MENLKTLIVKDACFSISPKHLPNSLRILEWRRFPSKCFPYDFHPEKLTILKLPEYLHPIPELDSLSKGLMTLTVMNFDHSQFLKEIPDVSSLQSLQDLSFQGCENLVTVHSSVGFLPKLRILNAYCCHKLNCFPPAINLPSLNTLHLSGCHSLENFPEILHEMKNVKWLDLKNTGIKNLPCSFRNLSGLSNLIMVNKELSSMPSVIGMMPQLASCFIKRDGNKEKEMLQVEGILTHSLCSLTLQSLYLINCELSDAFFPLAVTWFPNLTDLNLGGSNFTILPECIQEFRFLWMLHVDKCEHLREIRGRPPRLTCFSAINCKSLSVRGTSVLLDQELHEKWSCHFVMPGRIPSWFEQRSRGASISFWFRGNNFSNHALYVAILLTDDLHCNPIHVSPILTINGHEINLECGASMEQLRVFELLGSVQSKFIAPLFENEWNHAVLSYKAKIYLGDQRSRTVQIESIAEEIGMHVRVKTSGSWRQVQNKKIKKSRGIIIADVRFTDPYKMTELIIMMMMVSMVFPNHKNQPLLLETRIGLWTLLFLTHTALGNNNKNNIGKVAKFLRPFRRDQGGVKVISTLYKGISRPYDYVTVADTDFSYSPTLF